MAAPTCYHTTNKLKIAAILVSFILVLPSKSVGLGKVRNMSMKDKTEKVGSRPPVCVNKCSSCRPCIATLVIRPPLRKKSYRTERHQDEGDIYYLLSWKCKCGNKLYSP